MPSILGTPPQPSIGQDLLNVPMGDMIRQMASAIADAQLALDKTSMMVAEMMGGQRMLRDADGNLIDYDGEAVIPKLKEDGSLDLDDTGAPRYEPGRGPRMADSRVYFGYTYEQKTKLVPRPARNANGTVKAGKYVQVAAAEGVTEVLTETASEAIQDEVADEWVYEDAAGVEKRMPKMVRRPKLVSMLELGFTPTFYQFVDTIIEVKIAIKMTREVVENTADKNVKTTVTKTKLPASGGMSAMLRAKAGKTRIDQAVTSTVDGTYSQKYNYSAEGSSLLRTKLVPVPPPAILEERIREVMEAERDYLKKASQGLMGVYETGRDGREIAAPVKESTTTTTTSS